MQGLSCVQQKSFARGQPEKAKADSRTQVAAWRAANPEKDRARHRPWQATNPEKQRAFVAADRARVRGAVFAHYGTKCACCGSTKDLSIDHVNGDGAEHRRELLGATHQGSKTFYRWLIKNNFPKGFQVLCRPCSSSKRDGERCRLKHAT